MDRLRESGARENRERMGRGVPGKLLVSRAGDGGAVFSRCGLSRGSGQGIEASIEGLRPVQCPCGAQDIGL